MANPYLLVTNDDGPRSPFVLPFLRSLSSVARGHALLPVFPAEEQSWIGQAMTRFRPVYLSPAKLGEFDIFTLSGAPADCVGVGATKIHGERPVAVISGINVGTNAGLPFYLNSGTVGAVRQGILFGLPGIAISAVVPSLVFDAWRDGDAEVLPSFEQNFLLIGEICAEIVALLLKLPVWSDIELISVNVPWEVTRSTTLVVTELERLVYTGLFDEAPDPLHGTTAHPIRRFVHHLKGFDRHLSAGPAPEPSEFGRPGDLQTVSDGHISITPVRYGSSAKVLTAMERLESLLPERLELREDQNPG